MAKEEGFFSTLLSKFIKHFHHYIFFRKAVFFISGLIFGHSLVEHAVLATLILYITEDWEVPNLPLAVIILNAQEGLSSVFVVFEAHLADSYLGRFNVIIFSTISMIGGLTLLRLLNPIENLALFWGVAVLIALGEAGKEPALKAFLADQLKENETTSSDQSEDENTATDHRPVPDELKNKETAVADQSKGENRAAEESKNDGTTDKSTKEKLLNDRVKVWWGLFHVLGALSGSFGLTKISWGSSWQRTFLTTAIVMAASLVIFLSGFQFYHYEKPKRNLSLTVFRVLRSAISNRGIQYSDEPSDYFENDGGKVPLSPIVPLSRWVDKAALIVKKSPTSAEKEQANDKVVKPCTATQVKEVKKLLKMVPMWGTFIVYCVTHATGSTFFFEQTTDLDNTIPGGYKVPLVSFYLMQTFSSLAIKFVSNRIISSKWFKDDEKKKSMAYKVRIGLGMACSCLACVAAMLVEKERLRRVHKHWGSDDRVTDIHMSVFYLTPQFCLLGLMEGLTEDGLVDFFYYQVAESAKNYGPSFNEFAMGLGKFFSIFWVLAFKGWFHKTINTSRLDKYYMVLALVSFGNLFVVYTFVSIFFYKDVKGVKQSLDQSLEAAFKGAKNAQEGPRYDKGGVRKDDDDNDDKHPCCCFSLCHV